MIATSDDIDRAANGDFESKGHIDAIFGGQLGSEGKGVIVAHVANHYNVHVRVGAPNAGHSFRHKGSTWKMQTIPCGWINPDAFLIIGRGGLVNPAQLRREIEAIAEVDPSIYDRLMVDAQCGVLDDRFHVMEGGIHGAMHKRIGSTGEGVGPAREARLSRDPNRFYLFNELCIQDRWFAQFLTINTPGVIERFYRRGDNVLLEGAQGQGLSHIHGPWPYGTSTDPGPAQLAADVGVPPLDLNAVIAVFRTFPIRVAGNSGPLHRELSWDQMSEKVGRSLVE
jgi:adenylosuccinate synthase